MTETALASSGTDEEPTTGARWRRGDTITWTAIAVGGVVVVQQAVLVLTWFRHYVNEDLALLWAAARSWGDLQPRQPNFWGQTYGSTFESIPAELVRWFGIGFPTGLPLVLAAMHLGSWWIPAWAAWRRGRRVLALAAVAAPAILTTEYVISASIYGAAVGRLVAGIVAAIVIARPTDPRWIAAASGLAAWMFLVDSSSAILTVPACAFGVVSCALATDGMRARLRAALVLGVGLAPAAAWVVFTSWWYREHPGDDLHPAPAIDPTMAVLELNVDEPSRHFTAYSSELLRSPWPVIGVIVAIVVVVAVQRRAASITAALLLVGLVLVTLSIPKSLDGLDTVYFQAARTLLVMPLGVWFVAQTIRRPRSWPDGRRWMAAGIGALVAVTGVVRIVTWPDRGAVMREQAAAFDVFPLTPTPVLVGVCDRVGRAAAATDTDVAMFELRTAAYGCAGILGDAVTTVFPEYERRRWVLEALERPGDAAILFVGRRPPSCDDPSVARCEQLADDIVRIELWGRSPLELATAMGLAVRPFRPA